MTNKEKYPNADDALKALEEHNKHCPCGCTFEEWLDKETIPTFGPKASRMLGAMVAMTVLDALGEDVFKGIKAPDGEHKPDGEPSPDKEITGIECPICHGKNAKIDNRGIEPVFLCPDCDVLIAKRGCNIGMTVAEFKSFIADLCKKNSKKD